MAAAKKKQEETKEIDIPQPKVGVVRLRLVGTSPLIVNNFSEKGKEQMRDKQQGKAKLKKPPKDPVECFEGAKYLDEKGRDCVKAIGIKHAIVEAARYVDGLSMSMLYTTIFVRGDLLPIKYKKCVMREDVVRVGSFPNKTADLRYRPEYQEWSIEIDVEFSEHMLNANQVVNLAQLAGFHNGLCEWRPQKKGDFGRFEVEFQSAPGIKRKVA